ncbi:MAG: acetate--CoA ligase family protein [Candidatus Magnetomorum sp.]|nr:acetate--CoA ligase family protein [Candidatus Magnetomorum sp.]
MNLQRIFNAESVAVIGASKDEKKRGFQAIKTLLNEKYQGEIYPVNPKGENLFGLHCYKSILDIEKDIDIALITTPAKTVPAILRDCGKKGVAGVVIIAGGFGELGEKGKKIENEMIDVARQNKIRIIGPNTSGMINVNDNMNLVGIKDVPKGNIALLTQSGNIALHLIIEAKLKSQIGFSYYVGVGNEADIKFHEYLEFFGNDPGTKAILMYVEGLRNGRKFLQQVYKTTRDKPIILLKSGRSATGRKSAGSHTGSLAGISEVARTAFERAGIINIENSDELFPVAESLSSLPPIHNNKIAILADGGGHATIAADLLNDYGVEIPDLHEKTKKKLAEILPSNASLQNPIDVAGGTDSDPLIFAECARILLKDKNVGGLLIVGLFGGYAIRFAEKLKFIEEDAAHQIGKLIIQTGKPIILQSLYNFARPHSLDLLRYYGIPVYDSLDISCKCIGALAHYGHFLGQYQTKTNFVFNWGAKAKNEGKAIIDNAFKEGRNVLLEQEAKEILHMHGASVYRDRVAKTADEAVKIAKKMDSEVVLKIVSPDILHKTDAGGVKLKLKTEDDVRNAFNEIINNAKNYNNNAVIKGCLVSKMLGAGLEVIIGTKIDEQFGPIIMFGMGGIMVEVLNDVVFRVLPISRNSAKKMIREIKASSILDGLRGKPPLDKKAIINLLLIVSEIIESYPQIQEMDLNPVIVHENGIKIVDARIILGKPLHE